MDGAGTMRDDFGLVGRLQGVSHKDAKNADYSVLCVFFCVPEKCPY